MLVQDPRSFLQYAYTQRFCMPAFNVTNLDMVRAVLDAATLERAPVILQTHPDDIEHGGLATLAGVIKGFAAETPVPVFLHLDHGPSFEYDMRCLKEGYSSVMFDGFNLSFEEALAETALVVRAAHAVGSAVEGEVGSFGGGMEGQGESIELTDIAEVRPMLDAGVDMLAVSVGSEHGQTTRLQLPMLQAIAEIAQAPLVIHGGSGVHEDDVRAAAALGVVKMNIGSAISRAWNIGSREALDDGQSHYGVLKQASARVKEVAQHRLRLMGAAGKA